MTRSNQAATLAAKFREIAEARSAYFTPRSAKVLGDVVVVAAVRDAQADALAKLAELVSWCVEQLEPVR